MEQPPKKEDLEKELRREEEALMEMVETVDSFDDLIQLEEENEDLKSIAYILKSIYELKDEEEIRKYALNARVLLEGIPLYLRKKARELIKKAEEKAILNIQRESDLKLMGAKIQEYLDNQKNEAISETWTDEDEKDLGLLEMTIATLDQSITPNTSEIQKMDIMEEKREAKEQLDILLAKKERMVGPTQETKTPETTPTTTDEDKKIEILKKLHEETESKKSELEHVEKELAEIRTENAPERKSFPRGFIEEKITKMLQTLDKVTKVISVEAPGAGNKISLALKILAGKDKIGISADIENIGKMFVAKNLEVEAGMLKKIYIKSKIQPELDQIEDLLKNEAEKETGKKVTRIWIENGELTVEFEKKIEESVIKREKKLLLQQAEIKKAIEENIEAEKRLSEQSSTPEAISQTPISTTETPTQPVTSETVSQIPEKSNLEKVLDEARTKYANEYKKFLASVNKLTKAKRFIFGAKFKDKELPQGLKDLEKEYERATVAFGQEMYKAKEEELSKSALPENERKEKLDAFKQTDIFTEVIVKEQIKLNALKIENLPQEDKKFVKLMKKGLGWYTGLQPSWKKLAISTALGGLAFAVMPGTAITAGGMGTYLAIRVARGAAGMTAAKTTAKVFDKAYDWLFKEKSAAKRKKQEEELVNLFKEEESFDTGFAKSKEGYAKILERERKAKRNRLITKAVLSMAAGGAASIGTGYGIGQMMHGTPDSLNVAGGKENVGTDTSLKAQHNANAKLHEEYLKRIGAEKELEKAKTDLKEAKEALKEAQNSTPNASSTPNQASNQTGSQGKGVELKTFDPKSNAVVHKGEGIERVFIRQIDENPKLAQELGFKGDVNDKTALHKFAGQEAHRIALEKGYVDSATGKEVWIKDANKVAFELKADASGKPIVTLRTIDGKVSEMEYKEEGYKFGKTPNNEYEYEHQRASVPNKNTGVIEPNSTKKYTIGLKEETWPTKEGSLNIGTAENAYSTEKHSLGTGEEKSFFAEKIKKIKNIKEQIEANMDAENTKTNLTKIPRRQHWEAEQVTQPSATEIYNHDIKEIFTDTKKGEWATVRDSTTNNFLHDNSYNTENYTNLKKYINNLIDKTNQQPNNGIFGFLAETNEEYIKRALKYATENNIKV